MASSVASARGVGGARAAEIPRACITFSECVVRVFGDCSDAVKTRAHLQLIRHITFHGKPPMQLPQQHNHAVNPARPPATTDDGISFDNAAGLKRFHSHSHQLHTFSHNAGWEGGLSKITRSIVLDQNSNNRNCTRDLDPPTHQKQCKFVRLTPLRSVRHKNSPVTFSVAPTCQTRDKESRYIAT